MFLRSCARAVDRGDSERTVMRFDLGNDCGDPFGCDEPDRAASEPRPRQPGAIRSFRALPSDEIVEFGGGDAIVVSE